MLHFEYSKVEHSKCRTRATVHMRVPALSGGAKLAGSMDRRELDVETSCTHACSCESYVGSFIDVYCRI